MGKVANLRNFKKRACLICIILFLVPFSKRKDEDKKKTVQKGGINMKQSKYQVATYNGTNGEQVEQFRKWNLRLTQKQLSKIIGISKTTWVSHVKGRTPWREKEIVQLEKLGMKREWFDANIQ